MCIGTLYMCIYVYMGHGQSFMCLVFGVAGTHVFLVRVWGFILVRLLVEVLNQLSSRRWGTIIFVVSFLAGR